VRAAAAAAALVRLSVPGAGAGYLPIGA